MFGVDTTELAIVAVIALIFIGPKDLPRGLRALGHWVGRVRGMARHFTSGIESIMREAELEEMEKKWREENERILALHPANAFYPEPGAADGDPPLSGQPDVMPPVVDPDGDDGELPPEMRPLP
jgi:sec-independent protein translocase protein TatB